MARKGLLLVAVVALLMTGMVAGKADVGAPSWWSGDCDATNWNAKAAAKGWTGAGAHRLGAVYLGVPVCGPRPGADGAPDVQWSRAGWGHFEWECTELVHRFMAQIYGVTAYGGNGNAVVRNYRTSYGGNLETVNNGTVGRAPVPGDIVSFDRGSQPGHAVVVATSTVNTSGNGTIKVMSQNDTADGWRTLTVSGWTLQGFGSYVPYGWLHDPAGRGGSTTTPGAGPTITINDGSLPEGAVNTSARLPLVVRLSAPAPKSVSIRWGSADGTASSATDYTAMTGILTIRAGATRGTLSVPVRGDATVEPNETFLVNLTKTSAGVFGDAQGVATILNDD